MTNYREILRLHSLGYSQRSIASSVKCSHHTVKAVLEKAKLHNITWPLDDEVTNHSLEALFMDKQMAVNEKYAEPDWLHSPRTCKARSNADSAVE